MSAKRPEPSAKARPLATEAPRVSVPTTTVRRKRAERPGPKLHLPKSPKKKKRDENTPEWKRDEQISRYIDSLQNSWGVLEHAFSSPWPITDKKVAAVIDPRMQEFEDKIEALQNEIKNYCDALTLGVDYVPVGWLRAASSKSESE